MTGLVRKATLLTLCGLIVAGAAMAGVPSAATSTIPSGGIKLGVFGQNPGPGMRIDALGQPDVSFEFTVTVRDLASNVVPNVLVSVDFSACHHLSIAQDQAQPGTTVDCTGHIVSVMTNGVGVAAFRIVGGGSVPTEVPPATNPTIGCGVIKVGTTVLGNVRVATPDQDHFSGPGGITAGDLAVEIDIIKYCLAPFPGPYYLERGDINRDGAVTAVDLNAEIDAIAYMFNPAHAANNGKTCNDAPHTCCSLLP
jgi:hypothetical protein